MTVWVLVGLGFVLCVILWQTVRGEAGPDPERDGITMKIRFPADDGERTLTVPFSQLADALADLLVGKGMCMRKDPPTWYRPLSGEALEAYAAVLGALQLQIVADKKNAFIDPLDAELHNGFVDLALDAAQAFPQAGDSLKLVAASCAVYAARAGHLNEANRARSLELDRSITDPHHPIFRLSPHLFKAFDDTMEAPRRRWDLGANASADYAAWLKRVA